MGKVELVIMRHARASGNRMHIMSGSRRDVALTSFGRAQARSLAKRWKEAPDVIITSPMKRARQTAYYFEKKFSKKAHKMDLLKEHDLGEWTGKSALKLKHEFPKYFFDYEDGGKSHFLVRVPGGESWEDIKKRAKKALQEIKKKYAGKKVLAFSHGIFTIACIANVAGIKPPRLWNYRLKNCEWVKFVI